MVDPLVEAHHRRAGGRHALEHAVGDAGEARDEFRQWMLRVDQLLELRPAVLVAGLYEQCADLDERGSLLGMEPVVSVSSMMYVSIGLSSGSMRRGLRRSI